MARGSLTVLSMLACWGAAAGDLCLGTCTGTGAARRCTFTFSLDVFASETGYYVVEGCEGVQPTLGMEAGVEYTFVQRNSTNWMHPLGFAYYADGAHKGVDELEPGINHNGSGYCDAAANTCMAPRYYIDGAYVGSAADRSDFGLDVYEPDFQRSREEWQEKQYEVRLTVTDPDVSDFFYFCHIHDNMSGRVKVLSAAGTPRRQADDPPLGYEYANVSAFDKQCGTYNAGAYEDAATKCPDMTFVCGGAGHAHEGFARCLAAVDCAMHVEMRSELQNDAVATFMHQMIPHHANAVNMAKMLLKDGHGAGDDDVTGLLWSIINTQNAQITMMRGWLAGRSHPLHAKCEHVAPPPPAKKDSDDDLTNKQQTMIVIGCVAFLSVCALIIMHVGRRSAPAVPTEPTKQTTA
eukprot:TRINITY_DN27358_c0_g1_i1.p2 TRINITY_DN27358_c0_g1~~TRINITY_DN27358_c0_g1_i1.p2  ORF type:complete len:407 (+),score=157.84 TRINITY_DN27358_c0_g1_i1:55-1275(+)